MRNKLYNRRLVFLTFCVIFFCILAIGSVGAAEVPYANFTSNTTSGDAPLVVQFNDTSTGDATSWNWDFGDNGTSTEQNPIHTYTVEGTYNVSLTASNEAGSDTIIQNDYVTVAIPPMVSNNLAGGTYNTTQTVTLTSDDPTATIYYAIDTTDPRSSDTRIHYTDSITINNTTTLRYAAVDTNGNWSQLYLQNYVIGTGSASRGQSDYTGPETNTTNWTYTTGGNINYSTPVTGADGTIYIGSSDGILYALNSDGTLKWTYTTGNTIYGSVRIGSDGTIYVGSYDQNLYAINQDGTLKWSYATEGYIYCTPTIGADGTVYVGAYDGNLYAINSDGTLKWSYATGSRIYSYGGSPTIGSDGTIYVGAYDGNLYAINSDGTLKWSYATGSRIYGPAVIGSDGTIYVGAYDGNLYALNSDGTLKWSYATGSRIYSYGGSPTIGSDGTIYVGAYDGNLYAINPDGTLRWSYSTGSKIYGSAAIDADGTIYVGNNNGTLYALNSDGTLKWSYSAGSAIQDSVLIGSDGTIYFGSGQNVYALKDVLPESDFTSSYVSSDETPITIQFTDTSLHDPTSWLWDFGDGTTSTEQNPTHNYAAEGNYTVSLTVTNALGSDNYTKTMQVHLFSISNSLASGTYTTTQTVTLTSNDSTATIYYVTDGTDPRTSSTRIEYMGSIIISNTTTLRYAALDSDGNWSPLYIKNYVVGTGTASPSQSDYTGPETNTTNWTYTTEGTINYATPVTGADGTIYIGMSDGILYALNSDGTIKWTYTTGGAIYGSATIGLDGTIYVGSGDGNLYALNSDGTIKWTYTTGGAIDGSAVIGSDGTIYVGSEDKNLYAINSDGTLKWSYTTNSVIYCYYGSPVIGSDGTIYVGSWSSKLYAINSDGTLKWTYTTSHKLFGAPTIGADGTIYIGCRDNNLYAINSDGTLKWTYTMGSSRLATTTIGTDGTLYVGSEDGTLYALNLDGTFKWSYTTERTLRGAPTIGADGTIYVGSADGILYALNSDGTLKWNYTAGSGPVLIGSDGTIYFASGTNVYALKDVLPEADFTTTQLTSGETPIAIQFTDESLHDVSSWLWDFGDGTTSTEQNPTHNYTIAGNYTISLTVTNAVGNDTETVTKTISIYPQPEADFTSDVTSGTSPLAVNFTEASLYATSWAWDFDGDGTIDSTEENPTYTYNTPGTYTVTLTATGPGGSDTTTSTITILPSVTADVTGGTYNTTQTVTLTTDDPTATIYYTTDSNDPTSNSTSIPYTGPIAITSTTTLRYAAVDTKGNWSPIYVQNYIIGTSSGSGLADTDWSKSSGDLSNTGQSDYTGPETNTTLWVYDTGSSIPNYGTPVIGSDGTIYIGNSNGLNALNPDGSLKWTYTTGNYIYSATIGADGTIYIGCWNDIFYALNPDGSLKWSYTTEGNIIGGASIADDGTIYIGSCDGNLYAFNPDGSLKWTYVTGEIIETVGGGPAIGLDGTIYVGDFDGIIYAINPDGSLKWSYITKKGQYHIEGISIGTDGTIYATTFGVGYYYENGVFGNYSKIYALNVDGTLKWTYTFVTGGMNGAASIGTDGTIYIGNADGIFYALNPDGTLKWSYDTGNVRSSATIGADGTIYVGSEDGNLYAFNPDGTVKWTYTTGGKVYGSVAIASDGTLYFGSYDGYVYAVADTVLQADQTVGTIPLTVNFTASAISPDSWYWDFGDGTTSTEQNPTHTYTEPGNYTVTLIVTDTSGDNSTRSFIDYIKVSDVTADASFTATTAWGTVPDAIPVIYNQIQFTDTSLGTNLSWLWDFGDGTTSTEQNPIHTYTTPGDYTVTLTVTNSAGSSNSTTTFEVIDNPLTVESSLTSGSYNTTQAVTLTTNDPTATIYYTTDGTDPRTSSTRIEYTDSIPINTTIVLSFVAVDDVGTGSQVQTMSYVIDTQAPTVTADPTSGIYNATQTVTLTATDDQDTQPDVYYTLNGDTPTTGSTLYTGSFSIDTNTTLMFIAVDDAGNISDVQSESYTFDTETPTILTVDPANGTTSLAEDEIFTIKFSEDIMEGSNWIELVDSSGTAVPFIMNISGNVLTITPTSDLAESSYKLMIHTGSLTDTAGNLLAGKSFRFSAGTAPTITSTSPANGVTNVSISKTITITFSEAIRRSSNFWVELVNTTTGEDIAYTSYITSGNILVIDPVSDLLESSYKLMIHTGSVTDLAGNLLAGTSFRFTVGTSPTITSTSPANGATNISTAKTIAITFSENIRRSSNFWVELVDSSGNAVAYTSYIASGNILVINPTSDLAANTKYYVKIHTGSVTDTAGNLLVGVSFSFTTRNT